MPSLLFQNCHVVHNTPLRVTHRDGYSPVTPGILLACEKEAGVARSHDVDAVPYTADVADCVQSKTRIGVSPGTTIAQSDIGSEVASAACALGELHSDAIPSDHYGRVIECRHRWVIHGPRGFRRIHSHVRRGEYRPAVGGAAQIDHVRQRFRVVALRPSDVPADRRDSRLLTR